MCKGNYHLVSPGWCCDENVYFPIFAITFNYVRLRENVAGKRKFRLCVEYGIFREETFLSTRVPAAVHYMYTEQCPVYMFPYPAEM